VAGIFLLALAVPRAIAAWEAVPGRTAMSKFTGASAVELRAGIAGLLQAIGWTESSRYLTMAGTLELLLFEQAIERVLRL
jgi:hypothetical protein